MSDRKLSQLQEAFCREFTIDTNATQAAIKAGYSSKYADRQAFKLVENSRVQARIKELREEREKRVELTADKVMDHLQRSLEFNGKEVDTEDGYKKISEPAAFNKAIELAMRHHGMLVDRKEITGKNGGAIELSDTERAARITAILSSADED